jgi:hypothetical protein
MLRLTISGNQLANIAATLPYGFEKLIEELTEYVDACHHPEHPDHVLEESADVHNIALCCVMKSGCCRSEAVDSIYGAFQKYAPAGLAKYLIFDFADRFQLSKKKRKRLDRACLRFMAERITISDSAKLLDLEVLEAFADETLKLVSHLDDFVELSRVRLNAPVPSLEFVKDDETQSQNNEVVEC